MLDLLDLLARLNDERGQTIVLVLHDLNEAARYADRIVAMRDGRVAADGPPVDILTPGTIERASGCTAAYSTTPTRGTTRDTRATRGNERHDQARLAQPLTDARVGRRAGRLAAAAQRGDDRDRHHADDGAGRDADAEWDDLGCLAVDGWYV